MAKQATFFSLMRERGRNKIQKVLLKKYNEHDSVQDKLMFFKRTILWYAMLYYPMLWYYMESMVCYEIYMLCYAMINDVNDKHGATVQAYINQGARNLQFW